MHWFVCNDAERHVGNVSLGGSAWRAGRFFLYLCEGKRSSLKAEWSFWGRLNWLEASVSLGGEDGHLEFALVLPRLAFLSVGVKVPRRWLEPWMVEDRVSSLKVGYAGSLLWCQLWHAQWAEDCGMTDYYRRQQPRKYTRLQLWPGFQFSFRPDPLRWIFGREVIEKQIVRTEPVSFEMDGRTYEGEWKLERWTRTRPRWPFVYGKRLSSWLEVKDPPQFAGKGENSWDCDDDGIYGMGSSEVTPAPVVGDYIKRVLEYRERYGQPRERAL